MGHSHHPLKSALGIATLLVASAGLAVALIPASAGSAAAASSGYTVSLIPVSGGGTQVAVDPVTDTLYVTDGAGERLIVVDGATGTVETTLTLGNAADEGVIGAVAVDQATDMVYVSDYNVFGGASSVVVVNGTTNTVAATITEPTGSEPEAIAVDTTTDTAYVANYGAHNVAVIDGATNAITAVVSTGSTSHPDGVAVDSTSDVAWVTDLSGNVIAIDGATDSVASTLPLTGAYPSSIAVNPVTDTVYVGTHTARFDVIDGATTSLTSTLDVTYDISSVAVDPTAGVAYATEPGITLIIDTGTNAMTDSLPRGGSSVVLAPTAGSAYEATSQYGLWALTPSATNAMSPVITSGTDAIFLTGQAGSATAQASALPAATFSEAGALPTGLTWNSDGTLAGTPAAGTGGPYPITITASNGIAPDFTEAFEVIVDQPVVITSPASTTFRTGRPGTFAVTADGFPPPTFTASGSVPSWVTLSPSGALSGTPPAHAGGRYHFTIGASNGVGSAVAQAFTLIVDQPPAITSARSATFRVGSRNKFTFRSSGYPAATLSERGRLPAGVRFVAGRNGTAVLTGEPARSDKGKNYKITIIAGNGIGPSARQTFTLKVS